MSGKQPITVVITGAAGRIGYSLIPLFCSGDILGRDQPINLHLLDIPRAMGMLKGVTMEIEDCAFPLVRSIVATDDMKTAFTGVQVAAMVGGFPRLKGMLRKDLLEKNSPIFISQGEALSEHAAKDCKVVVVANPANSNCLQLQRHCPKIPKENFTALTRLDMNRAKAQLAAKLGGGTNVHQIEDVFIWGNHSATMVPDFSNAVVRNGDAVAKITDKLDEKWLKEDFVKTVQGRGKAIIDELKASSAMSAARAVADHLRDWLQGSEHVVSMAVSSDGNPYGIKEGLVFSFPVKCSPGGKWEFVKDLVISDELRAGLNNTQSELLGEREEMPSKASS